MNKREKNLWLLFFCTVLISVNSSRAQTTTEKVNHLLNEEMKEQKIPGLQLVVIKNNRVILSENMGLANVEFSVPVSDSTLFSINSITKIFYRNSNHATCRRR